MKREEMENELVKEVSKRMQESHPELRIEVQQTGKNNSVERQGIVFMPQQETGVSISPVIYLDEVFAKIETGAMTIPEAATALCEMYESTQREGLEEKIQDLIDKPDYNRIIPEVINKSKNEEKLKQTPYRIVAPDVVMVARYQFTENGSTIISDKLAGSLLLTGKEVLDIAEKNLQNQSYKVEDMATVLAKMMGLDREEARAFTEGTAQEKMFVITNERKLFGATGSFLDEKLRAEIRDRVGGDYYLLPSSIHETIAVSVEAVTPEEVNEMVVEVNGSELDPVDVLAETAFFVGETLRIEIAGKEQEECITEAVTLHRGISM